MCGNYFEIEPKRKDFKPYVDKIEAGLLPTNVDQTPLPEAELSKTNGYTKNEI